MNRTSLALLVPTFVGSLFGSSAWAASVGINLSDSLRPVTHCGSGSLYGITETLPADIEGLVTPLKAYSYRNPALATSANQHAFGDAIKVSERLAKGGSKSLIQFDLADILPNWPYKWSGIDHYKTEVTKVIKAKIASGRDNFEGYEIWNEPDGTWNNSNGQLTTTVWKPMFDLIRSLDPKAKIIGPSISYYQESYMRTFLTYAKANNCLPDLLSWHQWGSAGFVGAYENYRALEKSLGISPIDISINEYSSKTSDPYEGCPGYSVPFIAKFERYKIISSQLSWWWVPLPGRLGSLLTSGNQKGGGWYMYKWYGDMTGHMVKTTANNDKSDGVDAFASIDKDQQYASIVLGGNTVGNVDVKVNGIPSWMGSSVNVKLESVSWANKDQAVSGTTLVSTTKYAVTNGSISVPVNVASAFYAYRLYVTPTVPAGVRSTARFGQKMSVYQIYDLRGNRRGEVDTDGFQNLTDAVAKAFPGPGIFLARQAGQAGNAQKVVVSAP
jgi:hypothetical protein